MDRQKVVYRLAKPSDLGAISFMGKELMDSHKKYGWYYRFKKGYAGEIRKEAKSAILSKESFALVAENNGKVIGYSIVRISDQPTESMQIYAWKKEAEIIDLYVEKGCREHHVGERLLKKSFELSKKKGIDVARVVIDRKNKRAEKFYKREGMDLYDEVFVKRLKK